MANTPVASDKVERIRERYQLAVKRGEPIKVVRIYGTYTEGVSDGKVKQIIREEQRRGTDRRAHPRRTPDRRASKCPKMPTNGHSWS